MKNSLRRMVAVFLAFIMVFGITSVVNAKTVSGEYGGGNYTATLDLTPEYGLIAMSYTTESPSDAQYVLVNGHLVYPTGSRYNVSASGLGGCYRRYDSYFRSGECFYYVGGTMVAYVSD